MFITPSLSRTAFFNGPRMLFYLFQHKHCLPPFWKTIIPRKLPPNPCLPQPVVLQKYHFTMCTRHTYQPSRGVGPPLVVGHLVCAAQLDLPWSWPPLVCAARCGPSTSIQIVLFFAFMVSSMSNSESEQYTLSLNLSTKANVVCHLFF